MEHHAVARMLAVPRGLLAGMLVAPVGHAVGQRRHDAACCRAAPWKRRSRYL